MILHSQLGAFRGKMSATVSLYVGHLIPWLIKTTLKLYQNEWSNASLMMLCYSIYMLAIYIYDVFLFISSLRMLHKVFGHIHPSPRSTPFLFKFTEFLFLNPSHQLYVLQLLSLYTFISLWVLCVTHHLWLLAAFQMSVEGCTGLWE